MELVNQYIKEIQEDVTLDQLSLKDKQLRLPGIKHKWVGRLMRHKGELSELKRRQKHLLREGTTKVNESSPVKLATTTIEGMIIKSDQYQDIQNKIEDLSVIIEYLEKVEKICGNMTYDIKNLTEIIKLETL